MMIRSYPLEKALQPEATEEDYKELWDSVKNEEKVRKMLLEKRYELSTGKEYQDQVNDIK